MIIIGIVIIVIIYCYVHKLSIAARLKPPTVARIQRQQHSVATYIISAPLV